MLNHVNANTSTKLKVHGFPVRFMYYVRIFFAHKIVLKVTVVPWYTRIWRNFVCVRVTNTVTTLHILTNRKQKSPLRLDAQLFKKASQFSLKPEDTKGL